MTSLAPVFQDLKQQIELNNSIHSKNPSVRSKRGSAQQKAPEDRKKVNDKEEAYRNMDEHRIPLKELFERYKSDEKLGMTEKTAAERNLEIGDNMLPEKKGKNPLLVFLEELFLNWFNIMLWISVIMAFVIYGLTPEDQSNMYLALVLVFLIFSSSILTFTQNAKADALMASFKNFLPQKATVIRDGDLKEIFAAKLVPGDVVELKMGEKVPADIRVIQSSEMKVDNSALTGECDPLLRKVECTHPEHPLETANLCFFGTLIKEGRGKGVVVNIGTKTVLGQIADLASSQGHEVTPLRQQINAFTLYIGAIGVFLCILFFILGLVVVKQGVIIALIYAIGMFVANVPEGMLGTITIALAITAKKLAHKNVLVKNLESVETLGSVSCICSDKTGTLTQNRMTVEHLWYDDINRVAKNRERFGAGESYEYKADDPSFQELQKAAIISSEAKFNVVKTANIRYMDAPTIGDASETALIKFFQPLEDIEITREKNPLQKLLDGSLARLPFNSTNKFALSISKYEIDNSHWCVFLKGNYKPVDNRMNKKFDDINLTFGKNGERVLGFAKLHLPKSQYPENFEFNTSNAEKLNFPMADFTFVGLISLIDPPKETVPYAVLKCRSANIKVIMVTGDQPPTAAAIAKQVNIFPKSAVTVDQLMEEQGLSFQEAFERADSIVVHGDKINQAIEEAIISGRPEDEELKKWVQKRYCVFARTSPAQKLKIVRACQAVGYQVGVTGDGVNDSPAIKQGDIGISMGITGSDVTKDAADMILLNDDFASIIDGVEEGRKIFDNLKKTAVYILASNIIEIAAFLAYIIFQFPSPLPTVMMLFIDVGTDVLPAISLAYEQSEIDIMTRKPRAKDERLLTSKLLCHAYGQQSWIQTAGCFLGYFSTMFDFGYHPNDLFYLINENVAPPVFSFDVYDASKTNLGNSQLPMDINNPYLCDPDHKLKDLVDWNAKSDSNEDLRLRLVKCVKGQAWESLITFRGQNLVNHQVSSVSNKKVMYTVEAMLFAQTSYFSGCVMVQMTHVFLVKQRKQSFIYVKQNVMTLYGLLLEHTVLAVLCFVPGINAVFGYRPINIYQYIAPGIMMSIILFIWEETRKICMRNNKWFEKHLLW